MNKKRSKREKKSIPEKYRRVLEMPWLTKQQVKEIRHNLQVIAKTICEHVWGKKFH